MNIKKLLYKIKPLRKYIRKKYLDAKAEYFKSVSETAVTNPQLVVFDSYQGRNYSCSPKAIYEYMISTPEFANYSYVWVFRDTKAFGEFPENTVLAEFDSKEAMNYYAQAGTWITNSRLREFMVPRADQQYVQCWHGTPFKKIGCDIEVAGNATSTVNEIHEEYKQEAQRITKMISPSDFCTQKLTSAFALKEAGKSNIIIQEGYPRNDALFKITDEKVNTIKDKLGIDRSKRVVLYCPTFRDNQHGDDGYSLSVRLDFKALRKQCGENFVVLFRAHYFVADNFDFTPFSDYVINVSGYNDINDLYIVSDVLITDYSSVFFDYANLKRPIIFYLYDIEEYKTKMRDFYFGTAMLPGAVCETNAQLQERLKAVLDDFDFGGDGLMQYHAAMESFNSRFNPLDDAESAKRTAREIFEIPCP